MNRTIALTLAALVLAACSPDFDPASQVDKLRVLAIKAEPPEIDPGGVATLESLVLRADLDAEPARTTTVVHVACVPVPGSTAATQCVTFEALRDLGALVAQVAATACAPPTEASPAAFLAGVEACQATTCGPAFAGGTPLRRAEVAAPPGYFDALEEANPAPPELILGVQAVVLSFAIDAAPDDLVEGVVTTCPEADLVAGLARLWPTREHVLATKRVVIRGPDAPDPTNGNPEFDAILAGTTELNPDLATTVRPGTVYLAPKLKPEADAPHEEYTELDAAGLPIQTGKREEWVYSWFATAGEIDKLHTEDGESEEWRVAGAPGGAPAVVAAVVRDLRGGVGWQVRRVIVTP